jgi:hypothetical protein
VRFVANFSFVVLQARIAENKPLMPLPFCAFCAFLWPMFLYGLFAGIKPDNAAVNHHLGEIVSSPRFSSRP